VKRLAWGIVLLALAGCGGSGATANPTGPLGPTPSPTDGAGTLASPTVEPPAFDLAAVKANFSQQCLNPTAFDMAFCDQVGVSGMTANGTTLIVPTTLGPADRDRATVLCSQVAFAHNDLKGIDLGYKFVGMLNRNGGNLASCTVG
jgi:hypothetical protein